MSLLKKLIKDAQKKIDRTNADFCSTPQADARKLSELVAGTILLGKGNVDDLLSSGGKHAGEHNCDERVCTHEH